MTLSSGASPTDPAALPTQDQRLATAARLRRFGYVLLGAGALLGILGVVLWLVNDSPVYLVLLVTTAFDVFLALRQFAAARKV